VVGGSVFLAPDFQTELGRITDFVEPAAFMTALNEAKRKAKHIHERGDAML
jgi:hypothetical protein